MASGRATQRNRSMATTAGTLGGCRPHCLYRRIVRRPTLRTLRVVRRARFRRQPPHLRRRVVLRQRPRPGRRLGTVPAARPHRTPGLTLVRCRAIAAEQRRAGQDPFRKLVRRRVGQGSPHHHRPVHQAPRHRRRNGADQPAPPGQGGHDTTATPRGQRLPQQPPQGPSQGPPTRPPQCPTETPPEGWGTVEEEVEG